MADDPYSRRPRGIWMMASVLILIGGVTTLVMIIEIIDSIVLYGFSSLLISSSASLYGFLLYGAIPILFYGTGMGLFMNRPWARRSALYVLPVFLFLFFMHQAANEARMAPGLSQAALADLLQSEFSVFVLGFLRSFLLSLPLIVYFCRPHVRRFFQNR